MCIRVLRKLSHGIKVCHLRGSNTGPSDLQSDALPAELKRLRTIEYFSYILFSPGRKSAGAPWRNSLLADKACSNSKSHKIRFAELTY